jgi:hypothetical protein
MGGTFTTMISGSRNHFDMAVRSEANNDCPGISQAENKHEQDEGNGIFLGHGCTHFAVYSPMNA